MPRACWQRRNSVYLLSTGDSFNPNQHYCEFNKIGPVSQSPLPARWPKQPWISSWLSTARLLTDTT